MVTLPWLGLLGGGVCTLASGVLFYLASRHQRMFAQRPNSRLCLSGATAMGLMAIIILESARSMATACFMVVLLLMLVCSLFPLLMAIRQTGEK